MWWWNPSLGQMRHCSDLGRDPLSTLRSAGNWSVSSQGRSPGFLLIGMCHLEREGLSVVYPSVCLQFLWPLTDSGNYPRQASCGIWKVWLLQVHLCRGQKHHTCTSWLFVWALGKNELWPCLRESQRTRDMAEAGLSSRGHSTDSQLPGEEQPTRWQGMLACTLEKPRRPTSSLPDDSPDSDLPSFSFQFAPIQETSNIQIWMQKLSTASWPRKNKKPTDHEGNDVI